MRGTGKRTASLLSILAVMLILSIVVPAAIAILKRSRSTAHKVACTGNLREIAKMGMLYADSTGLRLYPLGAGEHPRAHESLNVMVAFYSAPGLRLRPELFVCRSWNGSPAPADADGNFSLSEETCAYSWTSTSVSAPGGAVVISSDKHAFSWSRRSGHYGGMNVVDSHASVEWIPVEHLGPDGLPEGLTR